MSNYTKGTNFTVKDSLVTGNPSKLVKGSELDAEFTAIQTAVNTKADINSAVPIYAPTASEGTSTTQVATTAFVQQRAMNTALPGQSGNSGKYLTTNGTDASWVTILPPQVVRVPRTSNTILESSNRQNLIDVTSGSFTQTLTAAATLGSGWYCYYKNSGTGTVTLDPNASETINGTATYSVTPGMCLLIQCDGSNFYIIPLSGVGEHEVVVHTGNGYGSTNNKIRRFTTTMTNVGTAITYADSATSGASFTINEAGLYAVHYSEASTLRGPFGVSLNSAQLTTSVASISVGNRVALTTVETSGVPFALARVVKLAAGDVVRPHTDGLVNGTDNQTFFAIRKVGT